MNFDICVYDWAKFEALAKEDKLAEAGEEFDEMAEGLKPLSFYVGDSFTWYLEVAGNLSFLLQNAFEGKEAFASLCAYLLVEEGHEDLSDLDVQEQDECLGAVYAPQSFKKIKSWAEQIDLDAIQKTLKELEAARNPEEDETGFEGFLQPLAEEDYKYVQQVLTFVREIPREDVCLVVEIS